MNPNELVNNTLDEEGIPIEPLLINRFDNIKNFEDAYKEAHRIEYDEIRPKWNKKLFIISLIATPSALLLLFSIILFVSS